MNEKNDIRDTLPDFLTLEDRVILFDGVCKICSRWIPFAHKRDREGKLLFASLQSASGQAILEACGMPTDDFDTMVFIEEGRAYYRSTAVLKIVKYFRMPWPVLGIGWLIPRILRDFLYNMVAGNRYKIFGKEESCRIPSEELKKRILD